jgi:hypothetical protein
MDICLFRTKKEPSAHMQMALKLSVFADFLTQINFVI